MSRTIEQIRATHEYEAGLCTLPHHMREPMQAYIETGRPVGHFLTALLSNDFMETLRRADAENVHALRAWSRFLDGFAPARCYGSPEAVRAWQKKGGLMGGAGE